MAFLSPVRLVRHISASSSPSRRLTCSATPGPQKPAQTAEEFLVSLGISREHSRRAVSRTPRLARDPTPAKRAAPAISYLQGLGLTDRQVARAVQNAPQIIFRRRIAFPPRLVFLESVAGIQPGNLPGAVAKCPHVLWMDVKNAELIVETILRLCPLMTPKALGAILARVPQVLVAKPWRVVENLEMISEAGVSDPASMGRVVTKAPLVLVFDTSSIQKRLAYLEEDLKFSPELVGRILLCTPELLESSVAKTLRPRTEMVKQLVGESSFFNVMHKVPSLFGVEDIMDRVKWLSEDVGLSEEEIGKVLREAPAVMTYSLMGNLRPKWRFIRDTMGGGKDDIVKLPKETLCANLQQRAMPRYAFLVSNGVTDVSVQDFMDGSDADFCRNIAKCEQETFRSYVDDDQYLLFFSRLM